jgi:hypothetical protein
MIKYTPSNQLTLNGFSTPFENELSPDNRWVKLAALVPWDELAAVYCEKLSDTSGREGIDARMVIGAIIVKHRLGLDDRGTVAMIGENVYLQYFCGLPAFQAREPFHPTVFVDIRKRMGADSFDMWNERIIERADGIRPKKKRKVEKGGELPDGRDVPPVNKGTLKIDATVADQKIAYPTDVGLLNAARKEAERITDLLYKQAGPCKKPRDYRRSARSEYLAFSKKRRKTKKEIRKTVRKQLGYLKRDLGHIEGLLDTVEERRTTGKAVGMFPDMPGPYPSMFPLPKRDQRIYWVLQLLYAQQKYMYDERVHSVADRIVNIHQPYVRPIPRGKDRVSTEFGAKISSSETDGMARAEHISWDNFNESKDMELQVEAYRGTHGRYPELLLADRIYLNRGNRKWLKEKGIRTVGVPLGRPPKEELTAHQKRKRKKERNQRNHIEGKFGQGKNAYGLGDIRAKRRDTSESWIGAVFFVMNLVSLVKIADLHAVFYALFKKVFRYGTYPGGMKGPLSGILAPIGNVCRNTRGIAVA